MEDNKMENMVYTIMAYDGSEIIDNTLGASRRIKAMDYLEDRYFRDLYKKKRKTRKTKKRRNNLFVRLCG